VLNRGGRIISGERLLTGRQLSEIKISSLPRIGDKRARLFHKLIATKILLFLSLTDLGCLAPFDLLSFNNSVSHGARHPFLLQMSIPTSCNNNHNTLLFLSLTDSFVRIGFVRKEDIRWQSVQFAERELMLA
jgi:hypothetical protein